MPDFGFPFQGNPPSRAEWVLGQRFRFSEERWLSALPDPALWPKELAALLPTADGLRHIDRRTVFQIASSAVDSAGAGHALVAAMVWGTGTAARERARRLRVFQNAADKTCDRLANAINILRADGAVAAYDCLHGRSSNIRYLGPSFGTKFLYFCGYDSSPGAFRPLILDRYVSAALNRLCGLEWPDSGFSVSQYAQYLELAHTWASAWSASPDVIERVLFSVGQAPGLAVASLSGRTH